MYKIILILMAIILLVFSANLSPTRPDQMLLSQKRVPDLALAQGDSSVGLAMLAVPGGASEPIARTATELSAGLPLQRAGHADGPAPALLVYIAFILIGSCLGIGIVRRNQRGL